MRFLCLYTADRMTPPTPQQMDRMGKYVESQFKAGKLVSTGGLKSREKDGFSVRIKNGEYEVNAGGAAWTAATGWAVLDAPSRDAVIVDIKAFLAFAGDGVSEVIQISDPPPQA